MNLLGREFDDTFQNHFNQFSSNIDSVVSFYEKVIKWDLAINRKDFNELIPVFILRECMELTDAISILIKNSSVNPASLTLRNLLERSFYLKYMFKGNTARKQLCYYYVSEMNKLDFYNSLKIQNTEGKKILNEDVAEHISIEPLERQISKIEQHLKTQKFKEIKDKYREEKKKPRSNEVRWYNLFDGPKSIRSMAKCLNEMDLYDYVYSQISKKIHANEVHEGSIKIVDGQLAIKQIRDPKDMHNVVYLTMLLSVQIMNIYLDNRIKDKNKKEDLSSYYESIREFLSNIRNDEYFFSVD